MALRIPIFLLSASVVGYEILLIRILSIIQWHHFAAMVISLALLGYGVSGTLLTLLRRHLEADNRALGPRGILVGGAALFGLSSAVCLAVAQRLPFNPLALVWDPRQLGYLVIMYLLLSVPFLCAASAIGVALMLDREQIHKIYQADLLGAGAGAAGIVALMFLLPVIGCLKAIAGLGLLASGWAAIGCLRSGARWVGALLVAGALASPFLWPAEWLSLQVSEYKSLSKTLLLPEAEVQYERSSPLALSTVVASPVIPFRHAPGLSLRFAGELPRQLGIFTDGDALTVVNEGRSGLNTVDYMDFLPSALPFHLLERPAVLVLGAGGGSEVMLALAQGARRVDAVEYNRQVSGLLLRELAEFSGNLYRQPRVRLHVEEARSFLHKTAWQYDLVQVSLVESIASSTGGTQAVSESYLYTVEAVVEMLERLNPGGLVAFTRWLRIPPRDNLKLFATAVEALERAGVDSPGSSLAMIRGWATVTTLVKDGAFGRRELVALQRFCEQRSFDVAYYPGMPRQQANRFNRLDSPMLYDGARSLLSEGRSFLERYKFEIRPATDDRPFFFHFFKWRALPELVSLGSRAGVPLVEWGYLMLVATVVQAVIAGAVLILLPLPRVSSDSAGTGAGRIFLYFAALGLAFLLLEIAFIQRATLFLGHPIYAVAVVLAAFLAFAGLGSGHARALSVRRGHLSPRLVIAGIIGLSWIYLLAFRLLTRHAIALPDGLKIVLALALLAPMAFLMGMPFPFGLMRVSEGRSAWLPWAWGINGCASVVAAALAPLLAIHVGFTTVVFTAAICYGVAGWLAGTPPFSIGREIIREGVDS